MQKKWVSPSERLQQAEEGITAELEKMSKLCRAKPEGYVAAVDASAARMQELMDERERLWKLLYGWPQNPPYCHRLVA